MRTVKSKAAYTNKWLSRNKCFWHEKEFRGIPIIVIDKKDAPKIVIERAKEINVARATRSWGKQKATDKHLNAVLKKTINNSKPSFNKKTRLFSHEK